MRFSDQDLKVLTNFSTINQNILFKKGKIVKTISTMKNKSCEYQLETEIPKEFALYDLNEFLNIHDLFEKPNIKINDDKIILKDKRFTSEYKTSPKDYLFLPSKDMVLTDYDYRFHIKREDIEDYNLIRKRTKKNLPDLFIQNEEGLINFKITDKKNKNSTNVSFNDKDDYEPQKTNRQFKFSIKCEIFDDILLDDYYAEVSPQKIMKISNANKILTYWFALENDSEFDSDKKEVKNNA